MSPPRRPAKKRAESGWALLWRCPSTAMMPTVDSRDKMTMKRGNTTPVILRNMKNKRRATVAMASPMNLRMSPIMARFKKCVTTGEPATDIGKSEASYFFTICCTAAHDLAVFLIGEVSAGCGSSFRVFIRCGDIVLKFFQDIDFLPESRNGCGSE